MDGALHREKSRYLHSVTVNVVVRTTQPVGLTGRGPCSSKGRHLVGEGCWNRARRVPKDEPGFR